MAFFFMRGKESMNGLSNKLSVHQIQKNKRIFLNYNRLRCQHAYDLDPEKASVVFEIIPVLLTINEVDLPGYVSGGDSGCGLYGVGSSYQLSQVIEDYFPEARRRNIPYQGYLIKRPLIESLFLLGSVGTVAQTFDSDFDFWVCVDKRRCSRRSVQALEEKTNQIAHWCRSAFGMDVHFFILDLEQVRLNDFGKVDEESSGSSQKKFLKEECYRTMLLVTGKIPYWWMVPPGFSQQEYQRTWESFTKKAPLDAVDFLDLGFLEGVSKNEFLGNALWQLSKGIKSPFKALLKMAMMELYLSEQYDGPLLCETLKGRVLHGCRFLREMDPYLLMVETILDSYREQDRIAHMDLLKKAFYLKAQPGMTRAKKRAMGEDYKVEVFAELMERWDWPMDLVEDLNQVENWSYGRQLKFSSEINRFFSSTYRSLSGRLRSEESQIIDQYDLDILGRKLMALFSRKRHKLKLTPFLTGRRLILGRCIVQYEKNNSRRKRWDLYDATLYPREKGTRRWKIFSAERVVKALAWLVNNGLYDFQTTAVEMPPNPSGVRLTDLVDLLKHIQSFFLPAYYHLTERSQLEDEASMDRIMVVIDMEEISKLKEPDGLDVIYRNSWGEMFAESYSYAEGINIVKDYLKGIKKNENMIHELGSHFKVHIPQSAGDGEVAVRLRARMTKELKMEGLPMAGIFRSFYGLEEKGQFYPVFAKRF